MAVNLQVGGAVREGAFYGVRPADRELPELLRAGGLAFVLAPRQMGKSSLRLRAAASLAGHARVAQVDLAGLGTEGVDPGAWFGSLAAEIAAELGRPEPTLTGAPARGWLSFVGDLLDEPVVLFLDELDVLRRLPFAEDVLGAVRAAHERAAVDPRWGRLGLCLLGAASPEALGVPLNVGRRVALRDFVPEELGALRAVVEPAALDAIYGWTAGHPYMTLRLGAAAVAGPPGDVDALVERFFLGAGAADTNLAASEREVSIADGGEVERIETYRLALRAPIPVGQVRPAVRDALELCGLVAVRDGAVCPRNRIVATVFDAAWAERVLGERSIRAAVRRWTDSARSDDELPHGRELAQHRAWAEGRADLAPDEHALLRRAAELQAEHDARKNAVALARARGWMSAALAAVGGVLALAAVALARERDVAREQAVRANELRLAAESVSLAGTPRLGEAALGRALAASDLDPAPDPPEVTHALAEALSAMFGRRLRGHHA
ncbi:MAG: AAA-like domain-containing protein, partial [Myxococcota bacterium]